MIRGLILVQKFSPLNAPLKPPLNILVINVEKFSKELSKEHSKKQNFCTRLGPLTCSKAKQVFLLTIFSQQAPLLTMNSAAFYLLTTSSQVMIRPCRCHFWPYILRKHQTKFPSNGCRRSIRSRPCFTVVLSCTPPLWFAIYQQALGSWVQYSWSPPSLGNCLKAPVATHNGSTLISALKYGY